MKRFSASLLLCIALGFACTAVRADAAVAPSDEESADVDRPPRGA